MPDNDKYAKERVGSTNPFSLVIVIAVFIIVGIVIYVRWSP